MSAYQSLKEEAYEANMQIPAQRLALYTWGNVSAFDKDKGVFAIKPSGVPYEKLAPDSMVVLDLEGNRVEGSLNPSSDTPTHIVLYKKFAVEGGAKIGGIIHTHSTERPTPTTSRPPFPARPTFPKKWSSATTKRKQATRL